ncbi:MAG TPA: hypothetical protein EYQ14_14280 [Gammaproteobacteria bacterium]|nr:hypothetical protein [Gammaproteobacteria bacterium]
MFRFAGLLSYIASASTTREAVGGKNALFRDTIHKNLEGAWYFRNGNGKEIPEAAGVLNTLGKTCSTSSIVASPRMYKE